MGMLGVSDGIDCQKAIREGKEKVLVQQHMADEVDINNIVARFNKTKMITHLNEGQPFYGDVSHLTSLEDSLAVVQEAEELFMSMDANVREKFANDPVRMIAFLNDEKNREEAVKLGMVLPKPVPDARISDVVDAVKSLHDAPGGAKSDKTKKHKVDED